MDRNYYEETGHARGPENGGSYDLKPYSPEGEFPLSTQIRLMEQEAEEEVHLSDYLYVIMRRKWLVLIFFISVVVTATLSSFLATPVYQSTASVRIDQENPNMAKFEDGYQLERMDAEYYETQYKILRSRQLAARVIRKLKLGSNSSAEAQSTDLSLGGLLRSAVDSVLGRQEEDPSEDKQQQAAADSDGVSAQAVDAFLGSLDISPVRNSQLVNISYTSTSPEQAMAVPNALAEAYIDYNIESKYLATQDARKWLEKQIDDMKGKIETSEEELNTYSRGNEMIFLDEDKNKESLITQKLGELSSALSEATTERIRKEAIWREIKESGSNSPYIMGNELLQELKGESAKLQSEYARELKTYKPGYPKMKRLKGQLDNVKERIADIKQELTESVESDYRSAMKREQGLKQAFEEQKRTALTFQERYVQYRILKREVDTNKQMYDHLLQRLKEVGVAATVTASNIQVLDRAEPPRWPIAPRKTRNILLSILLGLFGGVGLAFLVEYLDNTVKDTHEIERKLNIPSLGLIPEQAMRDGQHTGTLALGHSGGVGPLAEAFRSVGTFILLSSASRPPKTVLVTSPRAQEGKTTSSVNISRALSESFGKGVIVDADLRRPNVHNVLGVKNQVGLSTYLSGHIEFDVTKMVQSTKIPGLHCIPSGPVPPNPSVLLGSKRMHELVDALYGIYDFIVIDSPPVLGMTDSVYLANFTDGVILVVKAGQTPRSALQETKKVLGHVNANILGVVLNGIKESELRYGYYSKYYSSYYSTYK